jgi:hypothetical protein
MIIERHQQTRDTDNKSDDSGADLVELSTESWKMVAIASQEQFAEAKALMKIVIDEFHVHAQS